MKRRTFLSKSIASGALLTGIAPAISTAGEKLLKGDRIGVAVAGVRGRGNNLLKTFAGIDDVDVRYVCDIDRGVLRDRSGWLAKTRHKAQAVEDFRRALDDKSVHALVLGTPDHWHAIPSILACQAGKDVYVEKPDGHNILEGHVMVQAAKKHGRIIQLGTQARSARHMHEAMEYIKSGKLGRVLFAKAWESAKQRGLGKPADSEAPKTIDYDTWLGPAPKRPFNRLRFHGNWRWFFDYGSGDLGNDGVHRLDYALWGLRTAVEAQGEKLPAFPRVVSSHGGKNYFDDAQEWPDTQMTTYDFGGYLLTYEMRIWSPYPLHGESEGAMILGDNGSLTLGNSSWRAHDARGREVIKKSGERNLDATRTHALNFIDCMKTRKRPAADLETVGHPSSLLCHIGNAAWRLGRSVQFDAESHRFIGDKAADRHLGRETYRAPWKLPKV